MAFIKVGSAVRYGLLRPEKTVCLFGSSSQRYFSDSDKSVRIGCSSGFWGDTATAVPQLVYGGKIQYLIGDYLSELTMSLLAAMKAKNPQLGFTPDFIESVAPFLGEIKKKGIRVVTNAGGMNPKPCVAMLQNLCKKSGVELKIADVSGDNLMPHKDALIEEKVKEMFSGKDFPSTVNSMNAYYGAGPVVKALEMGADIVITGRCTDSALALAPLIHEFGWSSTDYDKLAAGSLAGHLIECGAQCTGGNHTDWHTVPDFHNLGFPIADVSSNGDMTITKPPGTGGILTVGSVAEQMLYEIGDPRSYILPDVIADFSQVQMKETEKGVLVTGARGRPPTPNYKVCATYLDGFKATCVSTFVGDDSAEKAKVMADSIFKRTRKVHKFLGMDDFEKTHVQIIGAEESFGVNAMPADKRPREAVLWMSAKHADKKALGLWAKEIAAVGTGGTPGIVNVVGGRPKPTPNLKLFSFLYPKSKVDATVFMDGVEEKYEAEKLEEGEAPVDAEEAKVSLPKGSHSYTLRELAFTRSGDKGNSCNVGVVARDPAYLPYIKDQVTEETVAKHFKHMFEEPFEAASAVILDGTALWVLAGVGKNNYFDSKTMILQHGHWRWGPDITGPRFGACAVTLRNGDVILSDGNNNTNMATVEKFSFKTMSWDSLPPLQQPRYTHRCAHVYIRQNGNIDAFVDDNSVSTVIVAGGATQDSSDHLHPVTSVEMLVANQWILLPQLPTIHNGRWTEVISLTTSLQWMPGTGLVLAGGCWIDHSNMELYCTSDAWKLLWDGGTLPHFKYHWRKRPVKLDTGFYRGNTALSVPWNFFK